MEKAAFIKLVAQKTNIPPKEAQTAVNAIIETIRDALKDGDSVEILNFGTFKISTRAAQKKIDPQTGKEIQIPAKKLPIFKPSKTFKEFVNVKHANMTFEEFINEKIASATFNVAVNDKDIANHNSEPNRWFAPISE